MSYPSAFVEFFGPCTWKAMHSVAFSYARDPFSPTPQEHKAAVDFFGSMAELIPCHMCRKHYKDYIREHPIKADNRDELAKWVFDLHNDVNRRTNKPVLQYAEVKKMYTGYDSQMHSTLGHMSKSKRLCYLADPHFGHDPATGKRKHRSERMNVLQDASSNVLVIALMGLVLGTGMHYFWKKKGTKRREVGDVKSSPGTRRSD